MGQVELLILIGSSSFVLKLSNFQSMCIYITNVAMAWFIHFSWRHGHFGDSRVVILHICFHRYLNIYSETGHDTTTIKPLGIRNSTNPTMLGFQEVRGNSVESLSAATPQRICSPENMQAR